MSLATFSNHTVATLVTSTFFLSLANLISYAALFALLGVVCLLILMFFYIYLPETKGKSLEDMSVYFAEITGDRAILDAERNLQNREASRMIGPATGTSGTLA